MADPVAAAREVPTAVAVDVPLAVAAMVSRSKSQSASPALLFPGVENACVPVLLNAPMEVNVALVGSNQRACTVADTLVMSTVADPVCAGGKYARSRSPSGVAAAAT